MMPLCLQIGNELSMGLRVMRIYKICLLQLLRTSSVPQLIMANAILKPVYDFYLSA